jgi:antitoxin component YwqK of YwqJK toxin-antitoxin module
MLRVHYDDLDGDEWGDDVWYFQGEPFTGMAYDHHPNGQLHIEDSYVDGQRSGVGRMWYPSGALEKEIDTQRNGRRIEAWERTWYEHGQRASETTIQFGRKITEKRWNEQGVLISEYAEPVSDTSSQDRA